MCGACVAQGVGYVGGALGVLRLLAARARATSPLRPSAADASRTDRELRQAGSAGW